MTESNEQSKDRVISYIDRTQDELLRFLSKYLQFRSVNPDMLADPSVTQLRQCQDWLKEELTSWGIFHEVNSLAVDAEQPNVVARLAGHGSGPALLFNGHTDVVPVTQEQAQAWSIGTPWGGEIIDDKICGRGASDMKGGNASFLWAIKALADTGVKLGGDLVATMVSGEETGNHTIGVDTLAQAGYQAPFAILAEPTDMRLCPASVGEFYFLLRVEGRSTSLANRHLSVHPAPHDVPIAGVNAIDKMWKIQYALAQLEREWGVWQRHPLMEAGNMNINFSRIHGGETYSAMAESCELTGSVLFNPALSVAEVAAEFRQAIDGVVESDYWLREHPPSLTLPYILDAKEPINVSPEHPGFQALLQAYRQAVGTEPPLGCTTGTSDGNYLHAQGQDIVTFGPGSEDAGVHGPNEYVEAGKLVEATKVYALMAIEWCGLAPST
jgi:acetylornithine deacetylase/succinyl-diaminopimelate desuccinylase-like protein